MKIQVKISEMKQLYAIAHASNDTVHQLGLHGVGKSTLVKQFAKESNMHLETLMLAQQEVGDLIGTPFTEDKVQYWTKPSWLNRIEKAHEKGKHCILHLDELSRATIDVRQSVLNLILEGKLHDHELPILDGLKTLIISSDNPPEIYQTEELDFAYLDRFATYSVVSTAKEWIQWALNEDLSDVIIDYIRENPDNLHFINDEDPTDKGASPRGWEKLSHNLKNIGMVSDHLLSPLIQSKVGDTIGMNFFTFYKSYERQVKPIDLVNYLEDITIKDTQESLQAAAKLLSIKTKELEQTLIASLSQNIIKNIKEKTDDRINYNLLTILLDSVNVEIATSIMLNIKENDYDFAIEWSENQPLQYLFLKIVKMKNM